VDYKTLTGKHFTVDACHSNGGVSSHCPVFHSPAKSFLCGDVCGERVWLSPPVARVDRVVKHSLKCKSGSPHNTSACIVVPAFTVQSGADCCKACGCQNNMLTVLCCLQRLVMVVVKCWRSDAAHCCNLGTWHKCKQRWNVVCHIGNGGQ